MVELAPSKSHTQQINVKSVNDHTRVKYFNTLYLNNKFKFTHKVYK